MELNIEHGRRKTFDVEFAPVTEENIEQVAAWSGGTVTGEGKDRAVQLFDKDERVVARQLLAGIGDVVVHRPSLGTFRSFAKRTFRKNFERLQSQGVDRSSETGQFVSHQEAAENPATTVHENVDIPRDADPS